MTDDMVETGHEARRYARLYSVAYNALRLNGLTFDLAADMTAREILALRGVGEKSAAFILLATGRIPL